MIPNFPNLAHPPCACPSCTSGQHALFWNEITESWYCQKCAEQYNKMVADRGQKMACFIGNSPTYELTCTQLNAGHKVVVGDHFMDWLSYGNSLLALKIKTIRNPNQVGTLDLWLAYV